MDTSQPTRDRILDAAMALFGERGYRGTTVGAIEQAAGLAPRRGGLYRHFPSKQELFTAAVSRYASKFRSLEDLLEVLDFNDEPATLTRLAQFALAGLAAEADLFRLLQRDGPDFPDLARLVHQQLVQRGYDFAVAVFTRLLQARGLRWRPSPWDRWSTSARTRRSTASRRPAPPRNSSWRPGSTPGSGSWRAEPPTSTTTTTDSVPPGHPRRVDQLASLFPSLRGGPLAQGRAPARSPKPPRASARLLRLRAVLGWSRPRPSAASDAS
jgi:AcrR family transcriptional regulator